MIYNIQSKNDLSAGACLVIRFPEEDLDKKALYTIEKDCPSFIIPFRHRSVDGQIECIYQLGNHTRFHYRFGRRTPNDYVELWNSLLQPILDCGDWFLKPSSFVLETENIFISGDDHTVNYIYVPSKAECVGNDALKQMIREIAQRNPVEDLDLENKVLRAIMQDIRPGDFLKMLKGGAAQKKALFVSKHPSPEIAIRPADVSEKPKIETPLPPKETAYTPPAPKKGVEHGRGMEGDISIDLDEGKPSKKKEKPTGEKKAGKKKGFNFFNKKSAENEIVDGAALDHGPVGTPAPEIGKPDVKSFVPKYVPKKEADEKDNETEVDSLVGFRLIGSGPLPSFIEVSIETQGIFTIGRFNIKVGVKQNSFEFDAKTRAVSRHHAVVERDQNGTYTIVDLNSMAGTFVDGTKLTPNIPYTLTRGCRVSFGTAGADYMWED